MTYQTFGPIEVGEDGEGRYLATRAVIFTAQPDEWSIAFYCWRHGTHQRAELRLSLSRIIHIGGCPS